MKKAHWGEWVFLAVWYISYAVALDLWRFKFGVFKIARSFLILGILLWEILFGRKKKSN